MRLSHSSVSLYNACSFKWMLHYKRKLRDPIRSSALHFGDCLDRSINAMLLDLKNKALKPVQLYIDHFVSCWSIVEIAGNKVSARDCTSIGYADSDFDAALLSKDDLTELNKKYGKTYDSVEEFMAEYKGLAEWKKRVGIENITVGIAKYINEVNWLAMRTKAILILKRYYEDILPKIKEVVKIQHQVKLLDSAGNEVIGYVDAILDFGNGPVICDLKTSARRYDRDAVQNSEQLALYRHCLRDEVNTDKAAFIVAYKSPVKTMVKVCSKCGYTADKGSRFKTCSNGTPRCDGTWNESLTLDAEIEIIDGVVDETFENMVVENFDSVLKGLEHEVFTKNWGNCMAYNRKCEYYKLCRKGQDNSLIQGS